MYKFTIRYQLKKYYDPRTVAIVYAETLKNALAKIEAVDPGVLFKELSYDFEEILEETR